MKYFRIILIAVITISLLININLIFKVNDLENRVNSINNYQQQILNSVNSQTNNINNALNDMKREQSWVSPVSVEVEPHETDRDKAVLSFEWQIKEHYKNSQVVLNYKIGSAEDYTTVSADENVNGLFRVIVPVEATIEPGWEIMYSGRDDGSGISEIEIKERQKHEYMNNQREINYFITSTTDNTVRSSEKSTSYIQNPGSKYYGNLQVFVDVYDGKYSISVSGYSYGNMTVPVNIKDVYLKKYENGQLLGEEKLVKNPENQHGMPIHEGSIGGFHTEAPNEKLEYTSMVLKVVYSDGTTFEKEIY